MNAESKIKTLVVNYSAPEINHFAAAMAEAGTLNSYVRPYANQGRAWEQFLTNSTYTKEIYDRTFGRRVLPPGISKEQIREAAIGADLLGAGARYFFGNYGKRLSNYLHWSIQKRVGVVAATYAPKVDCVVASYLVAKPAFKCTSGIRVLNYPTVHKEYDKKLVAEEADLEPEFASTLPDWSKIPSWVEGQLEAEIELSDWILVGSNFARDSFVAHGVQKEKLVVIPYGADLRNFSPPQEINRYEHGHFEILFVGNIGQRKGVSYLLKAYQQVQSEETSLTLVGNFNGNPCAFEPYRKLFLHIPHVPQNELKKIYQRASVLLFPSLIEGMGLVVLEAMACGLPVITTPNGPGEIVRDGLDGFVVPVRDVGGIVDRLEYLRANPEKRLEMGRNARQRALEYSWAAYKGRATVMLQKILGF